MANASRDENHVPIMLGVSSIDGVTPVRIRVDPITGYILTHIAEITPTINPSLRQNAKHDENEVPTLVGWNGTTTQALVTHNGYLAVQF